MNILNPGYFSADEFGVIVGNFMAALAEGGILAIGSNEGPQSEVDGAIYRKVGGHLIEIVSSGAGPRCAAAIRPLVAL